MEYGLNAVCPGAFHTAMIEPALATAPDPSQVFARLEKSISLGRVGQPEDIAEVIYFLASQAAACITDTSVVVDGGLLAKLAL